MRILVTGGHGVIGTWLVKELRDRGFPVLSCDLYHACDEAGFSIGQSSEARYVKCDIAEFRQLERVILRHGPFDMVYNCAAEFGRWNGEDFYEQLWRSNVIGMKNIIRMQESCGFKLVHCSSSEVYGDYPNLMCETVPDEYAIHQMNDYAMTKWVNEMQIRNSATEHDTKTVVVRLFNTYGPGEYYSPYRSVNCRFLYSALHGIPWFVHVGHKRTSTYVEDAIITMANITDNFVAGETYNIGGDELHSIEELSDAVIAVSHASKELAEVVETERLTTHVKSVDTTKARRDLSHKNTVGLEEGLRMTRKWMWRIYKT